MTSSEYFLHSDLAKGAAPRSVSFDDCRDLNCNLGLLAPKRYLKIKPLTLYTRN